MPDASCTGWAHTGVVLHDCPTRITAPGVYDGCRFAGVLTIQSTGVTIQRSLVDGGHVESVYPSIYDLMGVRLVDVEISGPGNDGNAAIGNNSYTCIRCNVHGGNRGFAVDNNVVVQDSYAHDFWIQPASQKGPNSAHQTALSTHGGAHVQVLHSTLHCNSDAYACSNAVSFYSEDAPGIDDVLIQNCYLTTDAGYDINFGFLIPGNKPYDITNTRIIGNVFGPSEFGYVANWPGHTGDVWDQNVTTSGAPITP